MLLVLLQAALIAAQTQTWCGKPECPPKPQCLNAELDLIVAIDSSCSMDQTDFEKEKLFATALANASEARFMVSRFAGIVFGTSLADYTTPIRTLASRIFHPMQSGAASFTASLPVVTGPWKPTTNPYNQGYCGGTPTDEALVDFAAQLSSTRVANRMQVAVLLTDGIPTMCYTSGGSCDGTVNSQLSATNVAIGERFSTAANKLPALGSLIFTVGIGASLTTTIGATTKYGSITGETLLQNFASSPRMAFLATDFNVLITQTLNQVLDLLCFYVITVTEPAATTCYTGGTNFVIKAYNFFDMGNPKCRWQQVGTNNFIYTTATVTVTTEKFGTEIGIVGLVSCLAPASLPSDPYNAYLEISRDGTYYTSNQYSVLIRQNCSAPIPKVCPNAEIAALFAACNVSDIPTSCSSSCSDAGQALGSAFTDFSSDQITACVLAVPSTEYSTADKNYVCAHVLPGQNPCAAPRPIASAASAAVASMLFVVISFLFA